MRSVGVIILSLCILFVGCNGKKGSADSYVEEDKTAKQNLQGVWINDEDGDVALRICGDTAYFPDPTVSPLYFRVVGDTLLMTGANISKYIVKKLTPSLLIFISHSGDEVRLVKSDDQSYLGAFQSDSLITLNQQQLIKRDTVVYHNTDKYHCYVQVNPTSYKVIKSSFNDDGMEVESVFYDNILHVSVYQDANKIYSSNVVKSDFAEQVPSQYLEQSILSDMTFLNIDDEGVHYFAILCIPNSSSNFLVEFVITYDGKVIKRIKNTQP